MPRDGNGTFVRYNGTHTGSTTWVQDKTAGTLILAYVHDTHDQDIADALTYSIAKDGQTVPTANLPMGTYRHTGCGDAVSRTDYATAKQVQDSYYMWGGVAGGTANAITLTLAPVITAYADGMVVRFKASANNTTAVTLNVNAVGAQPIKKRSGADALVGGEILTGQEVSVIYDGVTGFWRMHETNNIFGAVEGWSHFGTAAPRLSINPVALAGDAATVAECLDSLINTLINQRIIK